MRPSHSAATLLASESTTALPHRQKFGPNGFLLAQRMPPGKRRARARSSGSDRILSVLGLVHQWSPSYRRASRAPARSRSPIFSRAATIRHLSIVRRCRPGFKISRPAIGDSTRPGSGIDTRSRLSYDPPRHLAGSRLRMNLNESGRRNVIQPGSKTTATGAAACRVAHRALLRPGWLSWPHRGDPARAGSARAAGTASWCVPQRDHRADELIPTAGRTGKRWATGSPRATGAHSRHPALVADQALAADRMVDRAGRLGLLPGRIFRGDPPRTARGHQPRRLADPAIRAAQKARAPGPDFRPGRPDPVGIPLQHPAVAGSLLDPGGPRGLRPQRRRGPLLRASLRPRTESHSRRPGAATGGSLPALGRQFSASQEPSAPGSGRRSACPRSPRASSGSS